PMSLPAWTTGAFPMATAKPLEERLEPPMVRVELQPAAQPPTLPATVGAFRIAGGFRAWDLFEDHTPSCSAFTWAPRAPTTASASTRAARGRNTTYSSSNQHQLGDGHRLKSHCHRFRSPRMAR